MSDDSLESIRDRIHQLDLQLIGCAAHRLELARQVGEMKRKLSIATVDYSQERVVLDRARAAAVARGLDPSIAQDMVARLIRASVGAQEDDRVRFAAAGAGRSAVVVGGAGRMGRWMGQFLSAQGFQVAAIDTASTSAENSHGEEELSTADLIVMAVPPAAVSEFYLRWCNKPPRAVIVDIASIKTPLLEPIHMLQAAGGKVASIHPMFGPSVALLRDADVVICDTGDAASSHSVEQLFAQTSARIVHMPLDTHDRVMADLLSLAHATAIAFSLALPASEHPVRSTTFRALESLSAAVVRESADVYYEIQSRNPYSSQAIQRLRDALTKVVAAIDQRDSSAFRQLLEEGQRRTRC